MTNTANTLPFPVDAPPLRRGEDGAVRIGNSRVSLDLVVQQYENGMTPEEMVRAYDTLQLADVYAAISYYLRHCDEVRAYLTRQQEEANQLEAKIESDRPSVMREDLHARRSTREKTDAPTGN